MLEHYRWWFNQTFFKHSLLNSLCWDFVKFSFQLLVLPIESSYNESSKVSNIALKYHLLCWHYAQCFSIPNYAQNYAGIIRTGLTTSYICAWNGSGIEKSPDHLQYAKGCGCVRLPWPLKFTCLTTPTNPAPGNLGKHDHAHKLHP